MSPEALARLREAVRLPYYGPHTRVDTADFRALLDAYDTARADGVAAERARVVADLRERARSALTFAATRMLQADADRYERGEHDKEGT